MIWIGTRFPTVSTEHMSTWGMEGHQAHQQPGRPVFPAAEAAPIDGDVVQGMLWHVCCIPEAGTQPEGQLRAARTSLQLDGAPLMVLNVYRHVDILALRYQRQPALLCSTLHHYESGVHACSTVKVGLDIAVQSDMLFMDIFNRGVVSAWPEVEILENLV